VAVAAEVAHLSDVLYTWKRPVYLTLYLATDGWELIVRPALMALGADYVAVADERGQVWVISDGAVFADCTATARPLPTAAPALARKFLRQYGAGAFELSAGWTAACKRMARLMEDCTPATK
jgi:hypothetical protein